MPPTARVTKQMIEDAAFALVREEGHEALSARNVSKRLGCSTQPVLYHFRSIDEVRTAVYQKADAFHTSYLMSTPAAHEDQILAIGLAYVRFAFEEPRLFRFLFQSNQFGGMDVGSLLDDPELAPMIGMLGQAVGCGQPQAREIFLTLFSAVHGIASLLANNAMEYDEAKVARMLTSLFEGVVATWAAR